MPNVDKPNIHEIRRIGKETSVIAKFALNLKTLIEEFDDECRSLSPEVIEAINGVPHQEYLSDIAAGLLLCSIGLLEDVTGRKIETSLKDAVKGLQ